MELNRATQVIAAYEGDELAGVLLAEMYGEKPCCKSIGKQIYAGVFHWLQHIFVKGGVDCYDKANENMRNEYLQNHTPDGELIFLAANPRIKRKGTGSLLLAELEKERREKSSIFIQTMPVPTNFMNIVDLHVSRKETLY